MGVPILLLSLLAVVGGLLYRRRLREYLGRSTSTLDDDMIRRIETDGTIEVEERVDLDEARLEEERFWSETWDAPDEEW